MRVHSSLGLATTTTNGSVLLLTKKLSHKTKTFNAVISSDGIQFHYFDDTGIIIREDSGFEEVTTCQLLSISKVGSEYLLIYNRESSSGPEICSATSHNAIHWYSNGPDKGLTEGGVVVTDYHHHGEAILYGGRSRIYASSSKNLSSWERHTSTVFRSKKDRLRMGCAHVMGSSIHLFYFSRLKGSKAPWNIQLLRFDSENPYHRLDAVPVPIWRQKKDLSYIEPIGLVFHESTLLSYWHDAEGNIIAVSHAFGAKPEQAIHEKTSFSIQKHKKNPILEPINRNNWESQAVFNAAALYEDGTVHLVYRAVGDAGVSMLGYASSDDGITIDYRHKQPIYFPREEFEGASRTHPTDPNSFVSGPSWGGVEDPRLAKVEDRYYLTYVAFDGWSAPRLALSSISEQNFKSHTWDWDKPVLISKPHEVNKSGAILPEKVKGKYFVFHRVFPNLLIDALDSLDVLDGSTYLEGHYAIEPREDYWDSRKLGVGATPMKTEDGWLVIYHGVDDRDDSRYKIGAMLLDLNDPTRVRARTPLPIIEPTEHYENGLLKYGVVYPCGAVIKDKKLIVYYGGSDAVLCAATADAHTFVKQLKDHKKPLFDTRTHHRVVYA